VAGQPFIALQLRLLKGCGAKDVLLCVGHLGEQVEEVVRDGSEFGLEVSYSFDPEPLGTGGALRHAIVQLDERFLLLYGDSYLELDYGRISEEFEHSPALGLMVVYRNDGKLDRSNVALDAGYVTIYDKDAVALHHIDEGLTALSRTAVRLLPEAQPADLGQLFDTLIERRQLAAFESRQRFYEIGSPAGLAELRDHLAALAVASSRT
jgi:NDP-sugar pyrophosphorylase family protein